MKNKYLLITLAVLCLLGCKTVRPIYNVVALHDDANTITLRCNGYGSTEADAIADASRYAVVQLLFRGIPNSGQRDPLIGVDETTARNQYEKYLKDLLDNERYLSFLTQTTPIEGGREKRQNWIVADITINLRALRSDLEQAGIIRRFGL